MALFQDHEDGEAASPLWIWVVGALIVGVIGGLATLPDRINDRSNWSDYLMMPPMLIVPIAKRFGEESWDASIYLAIALQLPFFIGMSLLLRNWLSSRRP